MLVTLADLRACFCFRRALVPPELSDLFMASWSTMLRGEGEVGREAGEGGDMNVMSS